MGRAFNRTSMSSSVEASSGTGTVTVTTSRTRLYGVIFTPNSVAGTGSARNISLLNNNSAGDVLYVFHSPILTAAAASSGNASNCTIEMFPGGGILFPDGVKYANSDKYKHLTLLYQV